MAVKILQNKAETKPQPAQEKPKEKFRMGMGSLFFGRKEGGKKKGHTPEEIQRLKLDSEELKEAIKEEKRSRNFRLIATVVVGAASVANIIVPFVFAAPLAQSAFSLGVAAFCGYSAVQFWRRAMDSQKLIAQGTKALAFVQKIIDAGPA